MIKQVTIFKKKTLLWHHTSGDFWRVCNTVQLGLILGKHVWYFWLFKSVDADP